MTDSLTYGLGHSSIKPRIRMKTIDYKRYQKILRGGLTSEKRRSRIVVVRVAIIVAVCIFSCIPTLSLAWTEGLEKNIQSCPRWVAEADKFLAECKANARYFIRTFYPSGGSRGEKEENSAWFSTASADGHFFVGCTLNFKRELSFFGIYYTLEPEVISQANTAPIIGIGFNGDVVLSIADHSVTFVPVRPFDTPSIRAAWPTSPARPLTPPLNCKNPGTFAHNFACHEFPAEPINCQNPRWTDGMYYMRRVASYVDFSRFDQYGTIGMGSDPAMLEYYAYREFFHSSKPRDVVYMEFHSLLITSSDSVFIKNDDVSNFCSRNITKIIAERLARSSFLSHQLCRVGKVGFWRAR